MTRAELPTCPRANQSLASRTGDCRGVLAWLEADARRVRELGRKPGGEFLEAHQTQWWHTGMVIDADATGAFGKPGR